MTARAGSRWWVVAAMSAASIVLTIDLFGVNIALPSIARDLDLSDATLQWVPSIYFLMLAAPLVAAGRLGDAFGRRRVLVVGAIGAAAGSLCAALAPDAAVLLLARAVSGVGAALVTALSLSIVSEAFPPERRGFAIGLWSGVGAVGAAAGPLIGGLVTETLGWRWLFALDVPVAIAAVAITLAVVPESRGPSDRRVDVTGVVLVTAGFGLLALGLLEAPTAGWGAPGVLASLVVGVGAIVAFVLWERSRRDPLVDLGWLRRPSAFGTGLVALAGNAAFATVMLYLTLYFQLVRGDGAIATGLAFLAFTVPLGLGSPVAGALTARIPPQVTMIAGSVVLAVGAAILALLTAETPVWVAYLGLGISGVGQAAVFNVTNIEVVSSASADEEGMAAGVVSGLRQIGSLLGLAAAGVAFAADGRGSVVTAASASAADAFVDGLRAAMIVTVGFCLAGAVAAMWVRSATAAVREPASGAR